MDSPFVPLHASTPIPKIVISPPPTDSNSFLDHPFSPAVYQHNPVVNLDFSDFVYTHSLSTDSFSIHQSYEDDLPLTLDQYLEKRSQLSVSQRVSQSPTLRPIFNSQYYRIVPNPSFLSELNTS